MVDERFPGPLTETPGISENLRMVLFVLGIGMFCGGVFGFVIGVIISGLVRAG